MAEQDLIKNAPDFLILGPEEVAREGYEALMNREVLSIPGPANRLAWYCKTSAKIFDPKPWKNLEQDPFDGS